MKENLFTLSESASGAQRERAAKKMCFLLFHCVEVFMSLRVCKAINHLTSNHIFTYSSHFFVSLVLSSFLSLSLTHSPSSTWEAFEVWVTMKKSSSSVKCVTKDSRQPPSLVYSAKSVTDLIGARCPRRRAKLKK